VQRVSLNAMRIILLLFLGAATVFPGPGRQHIESFADTESVGSRESLRGLLPVETRADGWRIGTEPEFFDSEDLWEYINGQAEMYLDYGFLQVVTADYTSADGTGSLAVEIYLMESPAHAFGIYAAERSPSETFIEMGVQGYIGENNLNFWKGPYYVKLTSFEAYSGLEETLMTLAGMIAGNVGGRYGEPELFTCFPEKNRVQMSERFIPKNFMGQPFLKNGYRVTYRNGEVGYDAFLVQTDSAVEAEEMFRAYRAFLESRDQRLSLRPEDDYTLILVQKAGQAVFLYGAFLGGVFDIGDPDASKKFVEEMIDRLRNRAGRPKKT
jgi:hypothetical protein